MVASKERIYSMLLNIVLTAFGICFMLGAFLATGIRAAFSGGPYLPISIAGRVILFVGGVIICIVGIGRLLH